MVVMKTLIGIDIGDRSPGGIGRVEPATEVVDIAMAVVIGFLDLNFLIVFDVCYKSDVPITSVVPTGDGTDLWTTSCPEPRSACTSCPHATISLAPQVHSPIG